MDFGKEKGGGGCEEAVLVVHLVLGQDGGQEVETRGPVESCNVCISCEGGP